MSNRIIKVNYFPIYLTMALTIGLFALLGALTVFYIQFFIKGSINDTERLLGQVLPAIVSLVCTAFLLWWISLIYRDIRGGPIQITTEIDQRGIIDALANNTRLIASSYILRTTDKKYPKLTMDRNAYLKLIRTNELNVGDKVLITFWPKLRVVKEIEVLE